MIRLIIGEYSMARPFSAVFRATAPVLATLTVLLPAVPAWAEAPDTSLRLTLTYPEQQASGTRVVTLRCDPVGGNHPNAAQACADLDETRGSIARTPDGRACIMVYSPVVAEAQGQWRGKSVVFRTKYGNECEMHA